MSILFADSNCDLNFSQIKQFGIEYINMPFSLQNNVIQDVSVEFFEDIFTPYLKQGNNLVYVHQGINYFNSYANLKRAVRRLKTSYPENTVTLIDSGNTTCGYSYIVYQSFLKHKTGCSDINLSNYVKKLKTESATLFSMNNANLSKFGFDIKLENSLIKPIVLFDNDNYEIVDKVTNRKKMYSAFVNAILKYGENVADYPIFISYSGVEADALELKTELEKIVGVNAKILINKMNAKDTYLSGNKTLAISFHKKNN